MVFDETGQRLTPTHAIKKGARYRYYVSTSLLTGAKSKSSTNRRIPAGELEDLAVARLRSFLADPGAILDVIGSDSQTGSRCSQLIERGREIVESLGGQRPDEVRTMLMSLL
jgi:site-specific DNA recombinase